MSVRVSYGCRFREFYKRTSCTHRELVFTFNEGFSLMLASFVTKIYNNLRYRYHVAISGVSGDAKNPHFPSSYTKKWYKETKNRTGDYVVDSLCSIDAFLMTFQIIKPSLSVWLFSALRSTQNDARFTYAFDSKFNNDIIIFYKLFEILYTKFVLKSYRLRIAGQVMNQRREHDSNIKRWVLILLLVLRNMNPTYSPTYLFPFVSINFLRISFRILVTNIYLKNINRYV